MEGNIERDCSALGLLFQQIITDLKNGTPLWEDLISKATKLHSCLKATILAISAYLDAFQRIADSATNTKGATKEIGTALTRICLRHKAVEARVKTFTSAIMDCLVTPLQEKLEDWKKSVINLDKEHSREYKKAKAELKKKSTDTLRLQKKAARKGGVGGNMPNIGNNTGSGGNIMTTSCGPGGPDLQRQLDVSMADVNERRHLLEEAEQKAACAALVEERSRYCIFVACLKPVVDEEVAMLGELTHLQEVLAQLEKHTVDPYSLPEASEQVIRELRGGKNMGAPGGNCGWSLTNTLVSSSAVGGHLTQHHHSVGGRGHRGTPPSSPSSSLGSRKSSVCSSISSLNSSSSGSLRSHPSPSHHYWHRSLSQVSPEPSGGSGGSDVSTPVPPGSCSSRENEDESSPDGSGITPGNSVTSPSSLPTASPPLPAVASSTAATWPNLQETHQFELSSNVISGDRPHTISSAYERGHQRPPLTVYTFRPPSSTSSLDITLTPGSASQPASPSGLSLETVSNKDSVQSGGEGGSSLLQFCHRPPIPQRCSSLERPKLPSRGQHIGNESNLISKVADRGRVKNEGLDNKESSSYNNDGSPPPISHAPQIVKGVQSYQQPLYVNMNELASMAAKKAQAKANASPPPPPPFPCHQQHSVPSPGSAPLSTRNLPPPPPPPHAPGALERHNSKRENESWGDSQGISMSRSSCESSGGVISSHVYSPPEDHYSRPILQPSSTSASQQMSHSQHEGSTTSVNRGGTLLRRSSTQGPKPPPPIRRTSSISSTGGVAGGLAQLRSMCSPPVPQHYNLGGDEATSSAPPSPLPPPPPPLTRDSFGGESRGSLENLPPPPAFLLDSSDTFSHCSPKSTRSDSETQKEIDGLCASISGPSVPINTSVSVANAVRTLTELNHQPASPGSLRRAALIGAHPNSKPEKDNTAKSGSPTRANLIQALSAKLGGGVPGSGLGPAWGGTSPRRRHSEDLCNLRAGSVNTMPHPRDRGGTSHGKGSALSSSPSRGQEDFSMRGKHSPSIQAEPLNSRLTPQQIAQKVAQQAAQRAAAVAAHKAGADEYVSHQQLQQQHPTHHPKAARVRQWISSRSLPDPKICHDSLMDQIRRGAPLRRTRGVVGASECPMPQLRIDN
ncbi:protein MTSS 1 isoform X2 [Ischnura elegans]|uniref:protein MTSS 1 isoform X2 n=1 Tax=Ischnura elegans TaxID=197161 RepID=UPI001ED87715|nr:protein MTSS 1 isoform X2 [Ischnura elegans]